ncbi:MAG: YfiR family protein [Bacteroidales bacterium]
MRGLMGRKKLIFCFGGVVFLLLMVSFTVQREYYIKAAFLEKFSRFIEWPAGQKSSQDNDYFIITLLGTGPVEEAIRNTYQGQKINNLPVRIMKVQDLKEVNSTDILYICKEWSGSIRDVVNVSHLHKWLMVAESSGAAKQGIHINFYLTFDETVHFEINEVALKNDGFKVNFLLLDVAKNVNPVKK